jgi:hypothetical protein
LWLLCWYEFLYFRVLQAGFGYSYLMFYVSLPASMLELARLIVDSKWVPAQPIIFLFNGAEEIFLLVIPNPLPLFVSLSYTCTHAKKKCSKG